MFKMKSGLRSLQIDVEKYKTALAEDAAEKLAQAALQWITEATGIIPVWSGASHGTFLPLASEIGFSIPIDPEVSSRIDMGANASKGDIVIDRNQGAFYFTYETSLPHLVYNEYNNANIVPDDTLFGKLRKPGPYDFQVAARRAFETEIRNFRLPDPFQFLVRRRS